MEHLDMKDILREVEDKTGKKQRRPILKKKRTDEVLTRNQVKAIKKGRKMLRKEMKSRGIKSKEEFELMASSFGLYFDKGKVWPLLAWMLHGKGLWALGASIVALLGTVFMYSTITQLRGHFTINMSDGMFREGFTLSETADFSKATTYLFCEAAENVPCISINHLPNDIDNYEGQHNADYFAYTYFIRNEGESTVGYNWEVTLNSESLDMTKAVWVMIFEDGEMLFYAKPNAEGKTEALPALSDNSRGYIRAPLIDYNKASEDQYQVIAKRGNLTYYRVIPQNFVSDTVVANGSQRTVAPQEVHKYTVVLWLEGDDPDCTDELIGGHVGMEMALRLASEETDETDTESSPHTWWKDFWRGLKFWKG
ncbi:MAG: hypothetical protein IJM99_08380 [Firmicutes bacterium]|nr:hypothetical protein [Bacillota bacterium]